MTASESRHMKPVWFPLRLCASAPLRYFRWVVDLCDLWAFYCRWNARGALA